MGNEDELVSLQDCQLSAAQRNQGDVDFIAKLWATKSK
jgi:hypothetical protein